MGLPVKDRDKGGPMRGRHRAVIQQEASDDVCDPGPPAMIVAIAPAFPDNRVHTLYAIPASDDCHHGATSDFTPFIMVVPVITVAPSDHRPSSAAIIAIANL